jgi:ABC-type transporter MlaC component
MTMYEELEHQFRKFLFENYGDKIEEYVKKQTNYVSVEKMMDLILSSITITFSIKDKNDDRINMEQYFDSIKYLINEVKDKS